MCFLGLDVKGKYLSSAPVHAWFPDESKSNDCFTVLLLKTQPKMLLI